MEAALEAEMTEHLGGPPGGRSPGANVRNGATAKTVRTDLGPVEVRVPRDRDGSFSPRLLPKRRTRVTGLEDLVRALGAGGLTVHDVAARLGELYGPGIDREALARISDAVLEAVEAWRTGAPDAAAPGPRLWTIGYERLLPPELAAELQHEGIERLVDVRFRPQSRRPGMSKTRLGTLMAEHGIAYEHRRELGTPPDIRWSFKHGRVAEGRTRYAAYLRARPELPALAAELPSAPRTALLCLEADPAACHRRVIAELLAERLPGLRVTDL